MKKQDKYKATYIVRIYRNDEIEPHRIVGVVEKVGGKEKRLFHTIEDMFKIFLGKR